MVIFIATYELARKPMNSHPGVSSKSRSFYVRSASPYDRQTWEKDSIAYSVTKLQKLYRKICNLFCLPSFFILFVNFSFKVMNDAFTSFPSAFTDPFLVASLQIEWDHSKNNPGPKITDPNDIRGLREQIPKRVDLYGEGRREMTRLEKERGREFKN
jgi:hypothetical protein